ncbi:MAG: TetR family transcriptional regulator C-terminal domain-containing protein [Eubacterium sp.]|nr:TetR family transcriptional regulator C-terminal domain-containing protein [Eubacterium sp.]
MSTMVETQKEYGVWRAEDMERFEWDCRFFFGGAMQIVQHWLQTDCRIPPQQLAIMLSELRPDSLCLGI